jgi:hypothetical protein
MKTIQWELRCYVRSSYRRNDANSRFSKLYERVWKIVDVLSLYYILRRTRRNLFHNGAYLKVCCLTMSIEQFVQNSANSVNPCRFWFRYACRIISTGGGGVGCICVHCITDTFNRLWSNIAGTSCATVTWCNAATWGYVHHTAELRIYLVFWTNPIIFGSYYIRRNQDKPDG